MLALYVPRRGDFFFFSAPVPVKSGEWSCREWNCTVYFSSAQNQRIYWFNSEVAVPFKNKGRVKSGPLFPERTKYWDKVCSAKHDITFGQRLPSWVQGWISFFFFFFLEARLPFIFFSAGRVRLCLHSLDGDYKYMENSRQNKVSNFISSKNIVPLSSSGLTVLSRSLTYCWMETQPVLHHYTVAQAARKYQPFIKSGPLSWNIKGKIKQMSNVRAKLLTDVWLSPL